MNAHEKLKERALADLQIKQAYDELTEEFTLLHELFKVRKATRLIQTDMTHTSQSYVGRLECRGELKRKP